MVISIDLEEDDPREDHYAQTIAERETWLRSFGMMPYTTPDEFMSKMNKENIESRKIHADDLPACEKVPGVVTEGFKEHMDALKEDCLTSTTWSGAISQVRHAIQHHSINKMIVLGSASIFDHTSEYLFWQHEMAFILAIFELAKQQAQKCDTSVPELIFQDPAFCTADHRLLNGLGARVVKDPMAFLYIDEHTLVFAKHIPLVVYFSGLLMTSPAVCVSTNLKQATEGALHLQSKHSDFGPGFNIRRVADRFMAKRKTVDLPKAMLRLYNDIPGHELDNLLAGMAVFWVVSAKEKKESVREAKQMGSLGKKAKKWLDSL